MCSTLDKLSFLPSAGRKWVIAYLVYTMWRNLARLSAAAVYLHAAPRVQCPLLPAKDRCVANANAIQSEIIQSAVVFTLTFYWQFYYTLRSSRLPEVDSVYVCMYAWRCTSGRPRDLYALNVKLAQKLNVRCTWMLYSWQRTRTAER